MSGWDLDPTEVKILDIWLSIRPQDDSTITEPSSSPTILPAANALLTYLTAPLGEHTDEFDDFSNRWVRLLHALIEFCILYPRSMDWGITVLFQVIKGISNDAICELGEGPAGARLDLERLFGDYVDLYHEGTTPRIGTKPKYRSDVKDQFAIQFSEEEVETRPADVIEKMNNLRKSRWKSIITQCFSVRCHVLEDPVHPYNSALDQRLLTFLNLELDLTSAAWNKVDCIGMLNMLRGSASYFLSVLPKEEREKQRQGWIDGLSKLIFTSGKGREADDKADDFRVKAHAAVGFFSFKLSN